MCSSDLDKVFNNYKTYLNKSKGLGLSFEQFQIKYSNREIWDDLFKKLKINKEVEPLVLRAIDKKDRVGIEVNKKQTDQMSLF